MLIQHGDDLEGFSGKEEVVSAESTRSIMEGKFVDNGSTRSDAHASPSQVNYRNRLIAGAATAALLSLLVLTILITNWIAVESRPLLAIQSLLLAIVSLLPAVTSMWLQGRRFDLFHPLFYACWSFFVPQFALSSLLFLVSDSETYTLLLADPWAARVAAVQSAILGSLGLSAGYLLPVGKRLGGLLPRFKALDYPPARVRPPAFLFILIGLVAYVGAFREQVFGYQLNLSVSTWGATFAAFAQLAVVGQAIIWYSYFRARRGWRLLALGCIVLVVLNAVASGSRAALLSSVLVMLAGYQYAQRKLAFRRLWKWGLLALIALLVGMVFGSYFRIVKIELMGRTTGMGVGDIALVSRQVLHEIRPQSMSEVLQFGWERIAERIDDVTSLGVILSLADRLKAEEVALGIHGNIVRDLGTAFVPRFLWPSKPVVGVLEQIGNLYFHTQYSSPAVTYMGDLYRNFGVLGVIPGMLVLGVALRCLYAWLIEQHPTSPLRVGLFLVLGWTVNYEALYSTYFPALIRTFFVCLVAIALVKICSQPVIRQK
jgi:hypothetical protein